MSRMSREQAESAAKVFRRCNWDVWASQSALGWELRGKAADGGRDVFGFSHNDMKVLVLGGQVASLSQKEGLV